MVRTNDPRRGNVDPADFARWPHDQRELQDDLWALALWLLPEAAGIWRELDSETSMTGREWEKWRAAVAVARLFERHGVPGLEARIRGVVESYKTERRSILGDDHATIVIRALVALTVKLAGELEANKKPSDIFGHLDVLNVLDITYREWTFRNKAIVAAIKADVGDDDMDEKDSASFLKTWSRRAGRILKHLRFTEARASDTTRERGWTVSLAHITALAEPHGVDVGRLQLLVGDPSTCNVQYVPNVQMSETETPPDSSQVDEL